MYQEIIALSIVGMAAIYTVYSIIKTLITKSNGVCDKNCACSAKSDIKRYLLKENINLSK